MLDNGQQEEGPKRSNSVCYSNSADTFSESDLHHAFRFVQLLRSSYRLLTCCLEPKGLSLQLHGPSYPHHNNSTLTPQSLNLTILCSTEASDPKFVGYDGAELQIEWSVPAGCAFKGDESPGGGGGGGEGGDKNGSDGDKPNESKGSGIGWFFLM